MNYIPPHNTFDQILNAAKTHVAKFSETKRQHLKEALDHGLGELKSENEMDMYLASYGEIHQAKLFMAFSKLPKKILAEEKISVLDYGCGQGIASMVLCDFLNRNFGIPIQLLIFGSLNHQKYASKERLNIYIVFVLQLTLHISIIRATIFGEWKFNPNLKWSSTFSPMWWISPIFPEIKLQKKLTG